MMVLVLGDNFEFFPAILMVPIVSFHVHLDLSHELFGNAMVHLGYEFIVRARLTNKKNL